MDFQKTFSAGLPLAPVDVDSFTIHVIGSRGRPTLRPVGNPTLKVSSGLLQTRSNWALVNHLHTTFEP